MTPKFLFFLSFISICYNIDVWAQFDPGYKATEENVVEVRKEKKSLWVDAGMGLVGEEIGYQASFNVQMGERLLVSTGFDRADYFFGKPEFWTITNSISLDLGYVIKLNSLIGYFTIGPSYNWGIIGNYESTGEDVDFNKTSLKFKAGLIVRKYYLGISPFFHFNYESSQAGITLNFVLGKNIK
ncbi:MAG: hypothetical protein JXR07_02710 [Reichenbachiella sp.]